MVYLERLTRLCLMISHGPVVGPPCDTCTRHFVPIEICDKTIIIAEVQEEFFVPGRAEQQENGNVF